VLHPVPPERLDVLAGAARFRPVDARVVQATGGKWFHVATYREPVGRVQ
jgi:hypothetical protein